MTQDTMLDAIDPDIMSALATREADIEQGASVDGKIAALLALGSVPIALGALARDADGRLGGAGGCHVDQSAAVLDVQDDRFGGVEGVVDLVAHGCLRSGRGCVRPPGRPVPVRWGRWV